jgi:taurine dioxygenase
MSIQVKPISGGVGVALDNVNIAAGVSDADLATMKEVFFQHGLVFLHGQDMTPEQHIEFAERWGDINVNRFFPKVEGFEKIANVVKEKDQKMNIGGGWHTDHSYDQIPALGSILLARETPPIGGDTLFACMYKAYESLSDGMKEMLNGLNAVHSSRHVFGDQSAYADSMDDRLSNAEAATQDAIHPVVITHPQSGRKALYVNPGFTLHFEGWSMEESKPLLDYLYTQATLMEHTTRFKWDVGSIAFWDNRCTWHYALNDYQGERREMHRITLEGGPLN